jgi:hypothetical protein
MKTRILLALVMVLILTMAGSASVAAGGAVVPFRAFYAMHPMVVGEDEQNCNIQQLPGEGQATHLGTSTWYSDARACVDSETFSGTQFGSSIFTAANGDQLIGTFSGVATIRMTPTGPQAEFSGTAWVTEGTGRFAGYTGTLAYWGTAWPTQGTGELYFDGTLTKPKKPRR